MNFTEAEPKDKKSGEPLSLTPKGQRWDPDRSFKDSRLTGQTPCDLRPPFKMRPQLAIKRSSHQWVTWWWRANEPHSESLKLNV